MSLSAKVLTLLASVEDRIVKPGSLPIPEGRIRRFHVTHPKNVSDIAKHGISMEHAKGIEGPKAIYSWNNFKDAQDYAGNHGSIIEFHHDPKSYQDHPYATRAPINSTDILAIHQPWHHHYHYVKDNNIPIENVKRVADDPEYKPVYEQLLKEQN